MRGTDKVFAPLAGRPLLYYPLALMEEVEEVAATVVVAARGREERVRAFAAAEGFAKVVAVATGGERRQDSARAGLAAVAARAPVAAVVLVHDAARPLADAALVRRVLAGLAAADGVVPVVPLADTVKEVDAAGVVVSTPARARYYAVQTPQAFWLGTLAAAYERLEKKGEEVTDDAAAVEAAGGRVVTVPGDRANFKVTYPEDLSRATALLATGRN